MPYYDIVLGFRLDEIRTVTVRCADAKEASKIAMEKYWPELNGIVLGCPETYVDE